MARRGECHLASGTGRRQVFAFFGKDFRHPESTFLFAVIGFHPQPIAGLYFMPHRDSDRLLPNGSDGSHPQPAGSRTVWCEDFLTGMVAEEPPGEAPGRSLHQLLLCFLQCYFFLIGECIQHPSVGLNHLCHIVGWFHPPFNLERCKTQSFELRQEWESAEIVAGKEKTGLGSLPETQAAGLHTTALQGTVSATKTAGQAQS